MKKTKFTILSILVISGLLYISVNCSKKSDPAPFIANKVETDSVILNNQFASMSRYYLVENKLYVSSGNFDIAYGNTANGLYSIYGPSSEYNTFGNNTITGTSGTTFYNLPNFNSKQFDTLVNKLAISKIVNIPQGTGVDLDGTSFSFTSSSSWAVGTTFALKLNDDNWAIAKITTSPAGSYKASGSVALVLKR